MQFSYKGRKTNGDAVEGSMEAPTRAEAVSNLRNSEITPLVLTEKKTFSLGSTSIHLFRRVKLSEKIIFSKNLSGMLHAGLSISRSLQVLSRQTKNYYFKSIIEDLLATIDRGGTFSDGLAKYEKVFSKLYVAMVKAGEESGALPEALLEIETTLEKTYALNRKIKSALMYPSIILVAIVIIAVLMFIFVVPTLTKTFKELGVQLPATTRFIIFMSDLVSHHIFSLLAGVGVLLVAILFLKRLTVVKKMGDWLVVRLPVIGGIAKEANAARTTRTLSSLLSAGVPISRALDIVRDVLQNSYYKLVIKNAIAQVEKGDPISAIFIAEKKLYPDMVGEMMSVGEETGKLRDMLNDIAVFYEGEVEAKTKDLSTIIEPILMIFIGAAVGFFAISMLSPMYSIVDAIK